MAARLFCLTSTPSPAYLIYAITAGNNGGVARGSENGGCVSGGVCQSRGWHVKGPLLSTIDKERTSVESASY